MIDFTDEELKFLLNALLNGHEFNLSPSVVEQSAYKKLATQELARGLHI